MTLIFIKSHGFSTVQLCTEALKVLCACKNFDMWVLSSMTIARLLIQKKILFGLTFSNESVV